NPPSPTSLARDDTILWTSPTGLCISDVSGLCSLLDVHGAESGSRGRALPRGLCISDVSGLCSLLDVHGAESVSLGQGLALRGRECLHHWCRSHRGRAGGGDPLAAQFAGLP